MIWNNIYDLIDNKYHRKISEVLHNKVRVTEPEQIAEFFNNYFGSVSINLQNNIPNSIISPLCFMSEVNDLSM